MTLSTTTTPNTSTEYSNSITDLYILANHTKQVPDLRTITHTLKNESTFQLGIIPVIFNLYISLTKLNGSLIKNCKSHFLHDIQNLYGAQNWPKNAPYTLFFNKIYYFALLINKTICMINSLDSWATNDCSPNGKKQLIELYIKESQPSISQPCLSSLVNIFFYYSTKDEFLTCIQKLETITGYKSRKVKEILQELVTLNFVLKRREKYFSNQDSLVLQLVNIEPLSSIIREEPLQFLATYVKTETLYARGLVFKTALFKDIHDFENIITLKTDRISYDDETSDFLKKLNSGDVIRYTPSINKPTIGGIKYPLNLMMYRENRND